MNPSRVIAKVVYTKRPEEWGESRWSRLRPEYREVDDEWTRVAEEKRTEMFPDEGLVFWYDSPTTAEEEGSWWELEVGRDREHEGKDKLEVGNAREIYEFKQLSGLDQVQLRREIAHGTLKLTPPPVGPVLARLPETDRWVGPLDFDVDSPGVREVEGPDDVPTGFLDLLKVGETDLQEVELDQRHVVVLKPGRELVEMKEGLWAAQDDRQLMSGLFKRLQDVGGSSREALDMSRAAFRSYLEELEAVGLTGVDARREEARISAARSLLDRIELQDDLLDEAVDALAERAAVKEAVERRVAERVDARLADVESEFEEARAEREREIAELEGRLESRREQLAETREELRRTSDDAKKSIRSAAEAILEEPVKKLTEHLVLRTLVEERSFGEAHQHPTPEPALDPTGDRLASVDELTGAAATAAADGGFDRHACLASLATVLCRRPLLVCGTDGLQFCRTLASIVSYGCTYEAVVPTSLFDLDDLFDLPVVLSGKEDPPLIALGELLSRASTSDHLIALIFRGVNRAPLEACLTELFPSSDPPSFGQHLPWNPRNETRTGPKTVSVSSNVQIFGTLVEGPSAFAVPGQVAGRCAIVNADRTVSDEADFESRPPATYVDEETRRQIAEEALTAGTGALSTPLGEFVRDPDVYDEIRVYQGIVGDPNDGMLEWLLARRLPIAGISGIRDVVGELPEPVQTKISELRSSGELDYLDRLTGPD